MDNDQFYTEALNAMIPNLTDLELETCLRVVKGEKREQIVLSRGISPQAWTTIARTYVTKQN